MQSLREFYKIGNGPSSSHTMGPKRACDIFKKRNEGACRFEAILYGSLALTGKGHLTDRIILDTLGSDKTNIVFDLKEKCDVHPNTMDLIAYDNSGVIDRMRIYSVGGGTIKIDGEKEKLVEDIYPHTCFNDIKEYCSKKNISLFQYVCEVEGEDIVSYLGDIWNAMKNSVRNGISMSGIIPGKLGLSRNAKKLYEYPYASENDEIRRTRLISAYTYAVSEENASGGVIVTAPTCGACGILPGILYYMMSVNNYSEDKIIESIAVGGLIGNIVKENASISGAECGCQAEVGTACSMAAAAISYLYNDKDIERIENSAEVAMEHNLGLTCDPIYGYVQIPCIERNAVAALEAFNAANLSLLLDSKKKISFDMVVETMYETGRDLSSHYRETSSGGLAKKYCNNKFKDTPLNEIDNL